MFFARISEEELAHCVRLGRPFKKLPKVHNIMFELVSCPVLCVFTVSGPKNPAMALCLKQDIEIKEN